MSSTVRAASWPRAAGSRAGGAIKNARPGRSPSRWKSPAHHARSAKARCAANCVSDRSLTAPLVKRASSSGHQPSQNRRRARRSFRGRYAASPWAPSVRCLSVTRAVQAATIATRSPAPSSRPDEPLSRAELDILSLRLDWCAPFELRAIDPDAVQDYRDLPRDSHAGLLRSDPFGETDSPLL